MIEINGRKYKQITDTLLISEFGDIIKLHYLKHIVQKHSGYHSVQGLFKDIGVSGTTVSKLVYETFIGKVPKYHKVMHKDGDKSNNHVSNLYLEKTRFAKNYGVMDGVVTLRSSSQSSKKLDN